MKARAKPAGAMCIGPVSTPNMYIPVTIRGQTIMALLDTGSTYTIMTKATFDKLRLRRWTAHKMALKGFSQNISHTRGFVEVKIRINEDNYTLQCYVVEDGLMHHEMILGNNFMAQITLTVTRGIPVIQKTNNELPENDIMMIEQTTDEDNVEQLPCVVGVKNEQHKRELIQMIKNYKPTKVEASHLKMELILEDNIPVYQHPRRLSAMEREVAQSMIEGFIREGIVRPSKSPYASPILLRKKPNGTYRFCVDYRKINEKIVKDRYPLPLMEDVIEALHGEAVFSSIDLRNGFYHVDIEESSIKYTSFITPDGQYEFIKAPFGLCNSPAIFQRYINIIFHEARQTKHDRRSWYNCTWTTL